MKQSELQRSFECFREQCIWLCCCYDTYAKLYESGADTKQVLEQSAAHFFQELNHILIEYVLLQICKITDPDKSRGRENLTVENLNASLCKANLLTDEIKALSCELLCYRKLIKEPRDRVISHSDKETALRGLPVGEHPAEEVAAFFHNLQKYADAVSHAVRVDPLDFGVSPGSGDVLDLINTLRRGVLSRSASPNAA